MKQLFAFIACVGVAAGVALADAPLAPSAVVGAPSTYDSQTVTVSGTVKNVQTREGRRGTMTLYQVCDSQCVNVVQFGNSTITEGQAQTVTGEFRASVERGQFKAQNVIMVGGHRPHELHDRMN